MIAYESPRPKMRFWSALFWSSRGIRAKNYS